MDRRPGSQREFTITPFEGCMMLVLIKRVLMCLSVTGALFLMKCGSATDIGAEGFQVGTLYREDGSVAANAIVDIYSHETPGTGKAALAKEGAYKEYHTITDGNGRIWIENDMIADGYYCIAGKSGVLKSFSDMVLIQDDTCEMVYDTLRETGSLSGRIALQRYGDDPRSTLIYVFGAREWGEVYDSGFFSLPDIAEGVYMVRFYPNNPAYSVFDTVITIQAGRHDTLSRPIVLPFLNLVTGFGWTMDTLMRCATFYWNRIDTSLIGGYQIATRGEGGGWNTEIILSNKPRPNDTSYSMYLNKSGVEARIRPLGKKRDEGVGEYSPSLFVYPVEIFNVTPITVSSDTVRTIGWTYSGGRFNVLQASRYNPRKISVAVYESNGQWVSTTPLAAEMVIDPLAIGSRSDTLYILDKMSDDSLCIRVMASEDSIYCTMNVKVENNFGTGSNLEFRNDGKIFISQYLTTYVVSPDVSTITYKNGLATHFGLSETGLFTTYELVDDSTEDPYLQAVAPKKIVKFTVNDDGRLDSVASYVCDKYGIIKSFIPKLFAANNSGTICCLQDLGLFVVYENSQVIKRVFIDNSLSVVDLILTDDDIAYLLYDKGRIDKVNLNEYLPFTP